MKWVALTFFVVLIPILAYWLKQRPRGAPIVWGALSFLPFVLGPWHLIVAPYSTPMWSGYVKGWEFSLLDSVALAVILGTTQIRWRYPSTFAPLLIYFLSAAVAVSQAKFGALALSYPIQLLRMIIVFVAVARVTQMERGERAVLAGLAAGIAVQALYATWARFGGALQTGGSLGHQNLLGFVSHMVIMPSFAAFLSGRWPRIGLVGLVAGIIAVILTVSRATIALSLIGLALTFVLCIALRPTGRKAALGALAVLAGLASVPLAQAELQRRFEIKGGSFFAEDLEREAFERAAKAMLSDKPMGVGPNHYVFVANTEGYSQRAGVVWNYGSRSTNVHNSYLLVAAETGYFGLIAMAFLLLSVIVVAFRTAWTFRKKPGAELLVGLGCGTVAIALHSSVEWMFVVYPTQYVFASSLGMIAGIRNRLLSSRSAVILPTPAPLHELSFSS